MSETALLIDATTVAAYGRGLLLIGPSGSGKSATALAMIALGAQLVSDDKTPLFRGPDHIIATAPARMAGRIEARGTGILALPYAEQTPLLAGVNLVSDPPRLPPHAEITLMGVSLPLLSAKIAPTLASVLMLILRHGLPCTDDQIQLS